MAASASSLERRRATAALVAGVGLVLAAACAGAALAGRPLAPLLDFPPRPERVAQPGPAWPVIAATGALAIAVLGLMAAAVARAPVGAVIAAGRFPAWGWAALAWTGLWWTLAWGGVEALAPLRPYAFTPLWLGYIASVSALARRRLGRCLLTDRPGLLGATALASAGFWWLFEQLNLFVGNWHYTGLPEYSDTGYLIASSFPFATVLPAVAVTWQWLAGLPRLNAPRLRPVGWSRARAAGAVGVAVGVAGLVLAGARPMAAYSMIWIGPGLVLLGLHAALGARSFVAPLARGDWGPLAQPALAALVCGVFWELWNWGSAGQWHYTIPYADVLHVFHMPLLGYAGYLPFGVVCAIVIDLIARIVDGCPIGLSVPDGA